VTKRKGTLYVKSAKTAIGTEKIDRQYFTAGPSPKVGGFRIIPKYEVESITKYNFVLPEDQSRVVEMVRKLAPKYGFDVEVVDVTKESIIHRVLQEEIKGIKTFPTLIIDSGEKIEGNISKEQIKSLLSDDH
jgi:glutaredoxin